MGQSAFHPIQTPEDPQLGLRLEQMLQAAGASADQAVCVAGPGAGDAMSALWRRGYDQVEAARRVTCRCADTACALLLVLGARDATRAADIVQSVCPILRPGGRLVISTHDFASAGERLGLDLRLERLGFCQPRHPRRQPLLVALKAQDLRAAA